METVKVYESFNALDSLRPCYVNEKVVCVEQAHGEGYLITSESGEKLVLPKGTIFTYTGFDS
tara:strand:+ start:224 stop:409 length:186 start_codon:yes stop_codon:yes gene_type:complete